MSSEPIRLESANHPSSASILVTGDVVQDMYIYQGDRVFPAQQGTIAPYVSDRPGGARGLYELLHTVRSGAVRWGLQYPIPKRALQAVHVLWRACEGGTKKDHNDSAKDNRPKKVWRVGQSLGYALSDVVPHALPKSSDANGLHGVIVIDDAGLGFRTKPAAVSWPVGVSRDENQQPNWIVHKMANPVGQGDLWRALIGGGHYRSEKQLDRHCLRR